MWYDDIRKKEIGYLLLKNGCDTFINNKCELITKTYWGYEEILEHTYQCKWFNELYPPKKYNPEDENEVEDVEFTCHFIFTTHGILYSLGEYIVYSDSDVQCLSFEYFFVDYENE